MSKLSPLNHCASGPNELILKGEDVGLTLPMSLDRVLLFRSSFVVELGLIDEMSCPNVLNVEESIEIEMVSPFSDAGIEMSNNAEISGGEMWRMVV